MRILWIAPKWPYPPHDGARFATWQLLRAVSQLEEVHFVGLLEQGEHGDVEELTKEVPLGSAHAIHRRRERPEKRALRAALGIFSPSSWPATVEPFAHPRVKRELARVLEREPFDAVVVEGPHPFAALPLDCKIPIIYRAHNVEHLLWEKTAASRDPVTRVVVRDQARRMKEFERELCQTARLVAPMTEEDAVEFQSFTQKIAVTPVGLTVRDLPFPASRSLFYLGRMDWPPNREGLEWFLNNVWPELHRRAPDIVLRVAGSGEDHWLEPWRKAPGVHFLGRIPDPAAEYAACHLVIAPVFWGSGTRVKILEAAAHGRSVIAPLAGAQGTPLEAGRDFLRAESADEWIQALEKTDLSQAAALGSSALARVKATQEARQVASEFVDKVKKSL